MIAQQPFPSRRKLEKYVIALQNIHVRINAWKESDTEETDTDGIFVGDLILLR